MIAFQLAGRATRDALYLSTFDLVTLPRIVIASSGLAAVVCYAVSRWMARVGPGRLVPGLFLASALLLLAEWRLAVAARPAAAIVLYLHFGSLGALLVSGFWALVNERFDPRTARRVVGRITLGATVGGVLGGLVTAGLPLLTMFPVLAVLHLACAGLMRGLGASPEARTGPADAPGASPARTLLRSPFLRALGLLVVLTAMAEGLLDYVFKLRATAAGVDGQELLRLFVRFYTVTAILSIVVQLSLLRPLLARLGVARSAALLPFGVSVGAVGSMVSPGLLPALVARGTEIVLRNSVFKGAYELLFTPVGAAEKRSTKLLVDVGGSRLGDVAGGAVLQGTIALGAGAHWVLAGVVALSVGAALLARRLQRGYVLALERGLARGLPAAEVGGATLLQTFGGFEITALHAAGPRPGPSPPAPRPPDQSPRTDRETLRAWLAQGLADAASVGRAITLLARDDVAPGALAALRSAGPAATPAMVAHLLDPGEDFTIRRRLVPALAERPAPESFEGLLRALSDRRFEVRYRAGRALVHQRRLDPGLAIDPDRVLALVLDEVAVERDVWESRHLIDEAEEPWAAEDAELLCQRAGRAMEHVFVLLSLVLPREPLRLAYRGLLTAQPHLRGTALEYLESVLPANVREKLWPFLEPGPAGPRAGSPEEALRRLLDSSDAIRSSGL